MSESCLPDVPLPSEWASNVKTAVLHVISLAQYAMVTARGWAANSLNARVRLKAEERAEISALSPEPPLATDRTEERG